MARLTVVRTGVSSNAKVQQHAHRASASEGLAARRLLEAQGFIIKGGAPKNGQFELRCPFHEGPGPMERGKGVNFYLDAESSKYNCHSASCGARGNLQTLEQFFGIDVSDEHQSAYRDRDSRLKEYERNLTQALRTPFYDHGLTDQTIERFRIGFEPAHEEEHEGRVVKISDRYVLPYLEAGRPKFFRYYQPNGDPKWKYTWERDAEATLFNAQDAFGDKDGVVYLAEGELKAMLLCQLGLAAVAVPGASMWKPEWQGVFTHAKRIYIVFDNDNPAHHNYDKPDEGRYCQKCAGQKLDRCAGHNPGQEAAEKRLDQLGWRAKNVLLPLPDDTARKTDVNDYFMRDANSALDFAQLVTGKRTTAYQVQTLAEIEASPPEESQFLVDQGILPVGGRLLIAGKPKVGKSIFADNLALSLAAGIPFLNRFDIHSGDPRRPGVRTLLLDRELSKWSLFNRLQTLMADRPGYRAASENLLVDHDHLLRLDQQGAYDVLCQLVEQNGAQVVIMDTAYKFLGGDVESSSSLMKAFDVVDRVLHATGCAVVMTHHHKKGQGGGKKENTDLADPDNVAGSFLWTGWPNATILLNFLDRSVENPFNSVCTFTAFRDAAPPEPLALYRSRESIAYQAIEAYSHDEDPGFGVRPEVIRPTTELVANLLLECCPTTEDDFLHIASGRFGVSMDVIRPFYIDALSTGPFKKSNGKPAILQFVDPALPQEQTWEAEHHLPEQKNPAEQDDLQAMLGITP